MSVQICTALTSQLHTILYATLNMYTHNQLTLKPHISMAHFRLVCATIFHALFPFLFIIVMYFPCTHGVLYSFTIAIKIVCDFTMSCEQTRIVRMATTVCSVPEPCKFLRCDQASP